MKPIMLVLGGFVMSLSLFAAGVAAAAWILMSGSTEESRAGSVVELWTNEPRVIRTATDLPRTEERPEQVSLSARSVVEPVPSSNAQFARGPEQVASEEQTGQQPGTAEHLVAGQASDAAYVRVTAGGETRDIAVPRETDTRHVAWCADRFRSYRVEDDTFRTFAGTRRPCVSPFVSGHESVAKDDTIGPMTEEDVVLIYASGETASRGPSAEHVASCFSRYRSYRAEDNTYQPYGGGPRRECR